MDPGALFTTNLERIEGIVRILCRRRGYRGAVAEDFESWVKERLIEENYRILRKFEGRSKLSTYLTVVLSNLAHDYRIREEGRWRPSAVAKRLGPMAIRLDTLIHRDGLSHGEAVQVLRSEYDDAPPDVDLHRMIAQLPVRHRPTFAAGEALAGVADAEHADGRVLAGEHEALQTRIMSALSSAMAELSDEDQVILRMRYEQGMALADVARLLGLEQKPLYGRVERLLRRLKEAMLAQGLDATDVAELLHDLDSAEAGLRAAAEVEGG